MPALSIQILTDNPRSWIMPYAEELQRRLSEAHTCEHITDHAAIRTGDVLFLLSCEKLVKPERLSLHVHNLVVHESALPHGRGWAPMTWQILEGRSEVSITLLDAAEAVDAGDIHLQDVMRFEGHELCAELRAAQGEKTVELCERFIASYPPPPARQQTGEASYYPRRTPQDSQLDPGRSLAEQFDLLRVADNERYPAWFEHRGHKYYLRIDKADSPHS